ncbi:NAD-dependent dehydratase [archaeon]|nr:NAD-dependent dehydratase [archaeon]|tara:strand:+ start:379 stop:1362 length:984 start_codon:yes stop_codon:yes gene_type:complete
MDDLDQLFADTYKGKRVLVTGADGFMGSHLTERLLELGAKVSIYVRGTSVCGTSKIELKNLSHVKDKLEEVIAGDIGSTDSIELVKKNKPEIIFHLAANAYVPNSFDHPIEVLQTNLIGTINMLHATMQTPSVKRVVCTSSSEIYGSCETDINEETVLHPTSPYAASKAAADRYCFSYFTTYEVPVAIIRPFNTYGPRHTYDVIPKFIELALEGKDLTIYGKGEQTRDFTYVDDMIRAFLTMGAHPDAVGKAINFGTGVDVSVNDIAEKLVKITGSDSKITHIDKRLAEVNRLCCNASKAKELFGWEPKISIDEGLEKNINFVKQQK